MEKWLKTSAQKLTYGYTSKKSQALLKKSTVINYKAWEYWEPESDEDEMLCMCQNLQLAEGVFSKYEHCSFHV